MKKVLLSCLLAGMAFTAANAQQHRHVTPMDSLRTSAAHLAAGKDTASYFKTGVGGDTVTVEGIVVFNPSLYGLSTNRKGTWLQNASGNGEWDAIHVMVDPSRLKAVTKSSNTFKLVDLIEEIKFYENFIPGYKVKVTGVVDDFQGYTQLVLLPIESEITDLTPNPIAPKLMDISTFSKADGFGGQVMQLQTGEPFESVYAEFRDVTIVDVSSGSGGRWFWTIQDKDGNKLQVRDASGYFRNDANADSIPEGHSFRPIEQSKVKYIRGVIFQSSVAGVNMYSIAPLMDTDLELTKAPMINSARRTPTMVKSTDVVSINAHITDDENNITSATLYYAVDGSANYTAVNMTETANNIYRAQIPAQSNNTVVTYFVKATNAPGLSGFSPDSFKTGHMYIVKNEGINNISDLQLDPKKTGASIWNGDTLSGLDIRAVVTAGVGEKDLGFLTIQDGTAPFSGIMIKGQTDVSSENIKRGDSVRITFATLREDFGVTILENVKLDVVSSNGTIPAALKGMPIDSIRTGKYNYAEAYESMLLEFNDVFVVETNADRASNGQFGEWAFDKDTADLIGLRVDDISNDIKPKNTFPLDSLTMKQELEYIRGILTYSFGNWKLLPRNRSDIAGFTTPEDSTGSSVKEISKLSFRTFPNPANNSISIQAEKSFNNAVIQVTDLQGKVVFQKTVYGLSPVLNISTATFSNGLYMIKISDKTSVGVQKIIVQH